MNPLLRRASRLTSVLAILFTLTSLPASAQSLLVRQGEISPAGTMSRITAAPLDSGRLVTAPRNSTNLPKLIQWSLDAAGNITRGTDFADSVASLDLSITALSATRVATAYVQTNQTLLVTTWDVPPGGGPVTKKSSLSGVQVTDAQIVTAASD